MSLNRQQRRAAERAQAKRMKSGGGPPPAPRPTGDFGVEVDHADGYTFLTLHGGYMSVTVKWAKQDVQQIVKMLLADDDDKQPEIVRGSGIIVAKDMP